MSTTLYRFFDAEDVLLYVGITDSPAERFKAHAATKDWWPLVVRTATMLHGTRAEAVEAERIAITREKPRYNIAGTTTPYRSKAEIIAEWERADPAGWELVESEGEPAYGWFLVLRHRLLGRVESSTPAATLEEALRAEVKSLATWAREQIAGKLYDLRGPVVIPFPQRALEPEPEPLEPLAA